MDVTRQLINYITDNSLSVENISDATGVDLNILKNNGNRKLNATEMLEVCHYLQIDPKSLV
ncbi:MAG: hypothetical protein K2G45_12085 [Lachnospiraceae bacterium]|nr:hypothetical protein [Lachnospiraceae bacterium]